MSAPLCLVLALSLSLSPAIDEGDDRYHFIAGLAEKGLHEMVVREATRFLDDYGEHQKVDLARYRLASALFDLDRSSEARQHFTTLADRSGFRFADEVAFRHGQCELEAGEFDRAVGAFERVRSGAAAYLKTPATYLLGEAHFRAGRFSEAETFYTQTLEAADAGEHGPDAVHGLAWCAFRLESYDNAVRHSVEFIEQWGEDPRVSEMHFLAGESHLEAGRARKALAEYVQVQSGDFHAAALRGAGFACAVLGEHGAAADRFGELLARYPESRYIAEAGLHRGIHLLKASDAAGALEVLTSKAAGETPEVLYWRGRAFAALDRDEEALAAFEAGLAQEPAEELAQRMHVGRGDALYELGETERAATAYRDAGSDYALHAAAVARLNDGFPDEAVQLASQLVDPERQSAYRIEAALTMAEGHFAQEQYPQAETAFLVVAREDDNDARQARATSRLGWCRYLVEDWGTARTRFEEVTVRWPDSPEVAEARFMLARAAEEEGDLEAAGAAYALYLTEHSGGPYTEESMVRLSRFEAGDTGEQRLVALLDAAPSSEFAPQAHFDLAERLAARGEFETAGSHYAAVVNDSPEHTLAPSARYGLAWCLYNLDQDELALRELSALAAAETADAELVLAAYELTIWSARRSGRPDEAVAAFVVLRERAEDEQRRLRAARVTTAALRDAERIEEAEALYAELLTRTKDRAIAVAICVECTYLALDRGDAAAAESQARAAHRYAPDDAELAEAFFFVGEAYFEAEEDEMAAAVYVLAADSPDSEVASRALYKGGFASLRLDDHDAAARAFQRLVTEYEASELVGESMFLLGEAHYRAGRYAQAIDWLRRMLEAAPQHEAQPKARYRLGVAEARTQRWREAAETLSTLAKRYPKFEHLVEADLWRGRALVGLDQRRGARAAFERVIELDRGILAAQAHIELGRLSLAAGEREEALSKFLYVAFLFAHPEEVSEALFMAGQILESKGDVPAAKERYREAVTQFPDTPFSGRSKDRLAELGG